MQAKKAGLNAGLWALYTFLSILASWFIGSIVVAAIMIFRDPELKRLMMLPVTDRQQIMERMITHHDRIIPELFLYVCGIGGYLFVRHLLLKRSPDLNQD